MNKIGFFEVINGSLDRALEVNNQSLTNKRVSECICSWIVRAPKVSSNYCDAEIHLKC